MKMRFLLPSFRLFLITLPLLLASCATDRNSSVTLVSKWSRFEKVFSSSNHYENPLQDAELRVVFTSPSGHSSLVYGFWDGERTWRVRFAPDEIGRWYYSTSCSDTSNKGLHLHEGAFICTAAGNKTRFDQHGPIRVSHTGHYLTHDDGTPFFWLADTAWNGALLSSPEEWDFYIQQRKRQKFTAIQWVTTQWRASPTGDRDGQAAYTGSNSIALNPKFFQRLDLKLQALNDAGLLGVPVLLWANGGGTVPHISPGVGLPDDQAILLARYMVARWGAHRVAWILPGDGDYRGLRAERWKRIGRRVFGDEPHAPVMLHPGGMHWVFNEFQNEKWLDVQGYQSGHGDDDKTLQWIFDGPLTKDWKRNPARPFINLEPPYEYHIAYQSKSRISPFTVRRAIYWSLLSAPTAGTTYGGHGVWGWDDGTKPPTDHPTTGIPLPLRQAIVMPGAEQMAYLADFFTSIDFWRLRPAPDLVSDQPGKQNPKKHIAAAQSDAGDLVVVYTPEDRKIKLSKKRLPKDFAGSWINPRTGKTETVTVEDGDSFTQTTTTDPKTGRTDTAVTENRAPFFEFITPSEGDWILLLTKNGK